MSGIIDTMPASSIDNLDCYQNQFDNLERRSDGFPRWVLPIRKAAFARFDELGFPTVKDEDWRFTSVKGVRELPFNPVLEDVVIPTDIDLFSNSIGLESLDAHKLVFVNGSFVPSLSSKTAIEGGSVCRLREALNDKSFSSILESSLGSCVGNHENGFEALNSAFFQDGTFVHVPKGKRLDRPVHIINIANPNEATPTISPRNLFVLEDGAEATILESHISVGDGAYFSNGITEFILGDNAKLEHCKFQNEGLDAFHLASLRARIGRDSQFKSHSIALGAALSRNNIRTRLDGSGLNCVLNGLYLPKGTQLMDHHMIVDHAKPNCDSHEYFNGILDDQSRGVFHGRILVRQEAQKTDAKQTNRNLLLSDSATANSKPQLEIYADDVRCTHGATIGQMDEEAIFYLRARGIGIDRARRMLMHGFAGEIVHRIDWTPLRERIDQIVWDRLES